MRRRRSERYCPGKCLKAMRAAYLYSISFSQQYAAQAYNAKQSNMLGHYRRVQGFWAAGAGF